MNQGNFSRPQPAEKSPPPPQLQQQMLAQGFNSDLLVVGNRQSPNSSNGGTTTNKKTTPSDSLSPRSRPFTVSAGTNFLQQNTAIQRSLESPDTNICNVWLYNFEEELQKISELVETYPMIAMDTEFPGVVIEEVSFALSAKEQ